MSLRSLFVDFNSYFASVEQHEDETLRGRPVGVVPVAAETTSLIAASYEAKAFGVGTGTLVRDARRLCPGIQIRVARPERYVYWHHRLIEAIDRAIPIACVGSIDEVACELVGRQRQRAVAEEIAAQVKREVALAAPGGAIRCSIGVAPNDFLAKTASDMRKPDGLTVIEQTELPQALHGLALRDLCGIGQSMEARLHDAGIATVAQLTAADKHRLRHVWGGIEGERMWGLLRGAWLPVAATVRGSIGHSHVLGPELRNAVGARAVLKKLLVKAAMRMRREEMLGGALAVRIRFIGHELRWERDLTFDHTDDSRELLQLLNGMLDSGQRTRLLPGPANAVPLSVSVTLLRLVPRTQSSGSLFPTVEHPRKINAGSIDTLVDRINAKFGYNKVYFGSMQLALEHDAAPMRIPFNRIPDTLSENEASIESDASHNALWLQSLNRFKVLAEGQHRQKDRKRKGD
ncbi:DNA polymerase-4 [Rhodanobacter sp. ANJX3]|uniref:DNA polymerase Y family protein n=1 Tax=unclassified Rhodanobacter TaxID=2621553 RepID=UPI0015CC2891|nr:MULTISPECIES: DNA polymerase [unclassified Rhodanobacter]MBB5359715.1 DNA polymerase-4 [Rhodanobacter sp. ANJX3]NYE28630.1 DNA polymerase-4 [Rhodanobacter sp. K2T2]